jgi:hypothetical protein
MCLVQMQLIPLAFSLSILISGHHSQNLFKSQEVPKEHNLIFGCQPYDLGCCIRGTHAKQVCNVIT